MWKLSNDKLKEGDGENHIRKFLDSKCPLDGKKIWTQIQRNIRREVKTRNFISFCRMSSGINQENAQDTSSGQQGSNSNSF